MALRVHRRHDLLNPGGASPTGLAALLAAAAAGGVAAARFHRPAGEMVALSVAAFALCVALNAAIILRPWRFRGLRLAQVSFVVCLFFLSDSVGRLGFQVEWRRTFDTAGPWETFTDPGGTWDIRYPAPWVHHQIFTPQTDTVVFKPARPAPAIEFSVTRLPRGAETDLARAVADYYQRLPQDPKPEILTSGPFTYPGGWSAYRIVHQTPSTPLTLRQENVFLFHGPDLFLLTATAVPTWFKRFPQDLQRFLTGLQFPD